MSTQKFSADTFLFTTDSGASSITIKTDPGKTLNIQGFSGSGGSTSLPRGATFIGNSSGVAVPTNYAIPSTLFPKSVLCVVDEFNIGQIGSVNSSVLTTDTTGVAVFTSSLPSAVQGNITRTGTVATGTWNGTLISPAFGGTGVNNGSSTLTLNNNTTLTTSGATNVTLPTSGTLLAGSLSSGQILVGTGTTPTNVSVSGDASLNSSGVLTLGNTSVVAGSYTVPTSISVDSKGRITGVSDGGCALGSVLIGDTLNRPTPRVVSGDLTLGPSGIATLANTAVVAGNYVCADITIDSKGRVIFCDNGYNTSINFAILHNDGGNVHAQADFIYNYNTQLFTSPSLSMVYSTGTTSGSIGTGFYSKNPNEISVCANGLDRFLISPTYLSPQIPIEFYPTPNLLYNASFQVWQRPSPMTVVASQTIYTIDRWQLVTSANNTHVVSRQTHPTLAGGKIIRISRSSGSTGTGGITFGQTLATDMSMSAIGKKVTLSFYARMGATWSPTGASLGISVTSGIDNNISGISGFTSGTTNVIALNQAITTTWTKYTFVSSAAVSSTATQLAVRFLWTPTGTAGANDYIELGDIQLNVGPFAGVYQQVPYAEELLRCMSFYQLVTSAGGYATSTSAIQLAMPLTPTMRSLPSIISSINLVGGGTGSSIVITDGAANYTQSSFSATSLILRPMGGILALSSFSSLVSGNSYIMNDTAGPNSALTFSAELF